MVKTRQLHVYMCSYYLDKYYKVATANLPFEYFMNNFRLLKSVPHVELAIFTWLS